MKVELRREPGSRAVLEIEVSTDEVARATDQAYAALARRVDVPGFRRGKAPRVLLERHLGPGALREEALRRLVPQRYSEAVEQSGIAPIAQPAIEIKDAGDGGSLRLLATVDVYPDVALPEYRALRVEPEPHPVTDEDVDRAVEDIRVRHGRLVSAAGEAARRGDFVLLTVTACPPGVERLQTGKELLAEIGGGLLPPEVEAALDGVRAGEERRAQTAAGEVAVRVADVRRKQLPAVDDAFAKTVSDQPTLAALRDGLRARLGRERAEEEALALQDRVLEAVLAQTPIELPESLVAHEIDHVLDDLRSRLETRGLTLESYLKSAGKDEAALREDLRPRAERRVRIRLLLEAVAEREHLAISEEEMNSEVENLAAELQQDAAKVRAWLGERGRREGLQERMLRRKALALLVAAISGKTVAEPGTAGGAPGTEAAAADGSASGSAAAAGEPSAGASGPRAGPGPQAAAAGPSPSSPA